MKKRMLKKVKRAIGLALVALFLVNAPMQEVSAAEQAAVEQEEVEQMEAAVREMSEEEIAKLPMTRTVLTGCTIAVTYKATGMQIEIYTGTTQDAPVVGVKDIKVEQKVWYGWKTVATSAGGEMYDTMGVTCTVTYTGAQLGETYQVSCVHFADLDYDGVTQYTEAANSTGSFTYAN